VKIAFAFCATLSVATARTNLEAQLVYPVNFQVGVSTASAKRNVSLNDAVSDRIDASIKGIEGFISPRQGGVGIGGRILSGSYQGEDFTLREGRLFVGQNWFRVELGYGERSLHGTDSTALFTRAGARSIVVIGGTGASISFSGSKYLQGDFSHSKNATEKPDGWEGETGIYYTAPRIPVFAQIGYRTEYFKLGDRAEHVSGIVFGAGLWLGGR
jgi:hypothetical protein